MIMPFILRKEYNAYCKWAVSLLDNCLFDFECNEVNFDIGADVFEAVRLFFQAGAGEKRKTC